MKFILWDRKDGNIRRDDDGTIISDGLVGRIGADNAFLATYARYPDNRRPNMLEVGESIDSVMFSLSGSLGIYSVYRVE